MKFPRWSTQVNGQTASLTYLVIGNTLSRLTAVSPPECCKGVEARWCRRVRVKRPAGGEQARIACHGVRPQLRR